MATVMRKQQVGFATRNGKGVYFVPQTVGELIEVLSQFPKNATFPPDGTDEYTAGELDEWIGALASKYPQHVRRFVVEK